MNPISNVADIYTVSKLLGHASVKTTEKYYVDLVDENYKSALDGLNDIIWHYHKSVCFYKKLLL